MSCDFYKLACPGVRELAPYEPGKPIVELQRELGLTDIVKLASNENPLGCTPLLQQAWPDLSKDLALYPDSICFELKQALAAFYQVGLEQITIGNGSNEILEIIMRCFVGPGEGVIIAQYAFAVYELIARAINAELVTVAAKNWDHDLDAMAKAVTSNTKIIFIANPNNPTGTCLTQQQLAEFLQQVPENVLVVLDEAYAEYNRHPEYPNSIALLNKHPNLVVTRTFSKAYGLAGLRLGYAISNPELADFLNRIREPFNVNSIAQVAGILALQDQDFVTKTVDLNEAGKQQFYDNLKQRNLEFIPTFGNFICIKLGMLARDAFAKLLHKGIIVRPLTCYDMPNHIRVSFGTRADNAKFFAKLDEVI